MSPSHSRLSSGLSPDLPDDLVLDILLRIPSDRPECHLRASLVSKAWRRALSDPAFCRRYRDFHRTPPLLGFLFRDMLSSCHGRGFVPTTAFRARTTTTTTDPSSSSHVVVSACHGRVLFLNLMDRDFLVWDRRPEPSTLNNNLTFGSAVLCATADCDHRGCHGGPFLVVALYLEINSLSACVYSSADGAWSGMTSVEHPDAGVFSMANLTSVLLGNTVYMPRGTIITAYNLDDRQPKVIDVPSARYDRTSSFLMTAHNGALGFAGLEESKLLHLWSRKAGPDGAMAWAHDRVIDLETVLPIRGLLINPYVVGFADSVAVVFIGTDVGVFTIALNSDRVQKVSNRGGKSFIIPYTSFYTLGRLPPP